MFLVVVSLSFLVHAACLPIPASSGAKGLLRLDDLPSSALQKIMRRESLDAKREDAESATPAPSGGASCSTNQMAYATLSDGTIALIDMGPNTMSGKTEVRRLTKSSNYLTFKEDAAIETRMHLSSGLNNNGEWTFLADGADNLIGINSGVTDSNMTEVHRLKGTTTPPYQEFDLNVVTALPRRTTFDEWDFLLNSVSDILLIKKGPSTPSSMTEIHKLSASASWQSYSYQGPTALHLTASTNNYGDWAFLLDGADNLICIRRPTTLDKTIEVKRLTAGSNYQTYDLENGGALLPHDPDGDVHWVFEMDPSDDVVCIKEGPLTKHGFTEVYRLSMASDYKVFSLQQEQSGAPCRQPLFTDAGGAR